MTFAGVPAISSAGSEQLASAWLPMLTSRVYDPRDVPLGEKGGVTVGMSMTEKQVSRLEAIGPDAPQRAPTGSNGPQRAPMGPNGPQCAWPLMRLAA